ncbi:MAG: shikimate kinase [Hormoscilla sp.]
MMINLRGISIYLVGMMGAGKTTVGELLAKELEYRFFDTDVLIERVKGKAIGEIFKTEGEAGFREIESQVLESLSAYLQSVVATGGGIVLRPKNWSYLHHGIVVWLDLPVEKLYNRLQGDTNRPLLQEVDPLEKLRSLLKTRQAMYSQADLHITLTGEETPEGVARRVLGEIPTIIKPEVKAREWN